ncbi:MAG: hypothetical protein NUW37_04595 [Planctomycetes bacterium]|nr:hypothetical protein [Planctomycetota bacterium]
MGTYLPDIPKSQREAGNISYPVQDEKEYEQADGSNRNYNGMVDSPNVSVGQVFDAWDHFNDSDDVNILVPKNPITGNPTFQGFAIVQNFFVYLRCGNNVIGQWEWRAYNVHEIGNNSEGNDNANSDRNRTFINESEIQRINPITPTLYNQWVGNDGMIKDAPPELRNPWD